MKTLTLISKQQRLAIYVDSFTDYCEALSYGDPLMMQLMLVNKPLNSWFSRQFKMGEQRFINYMARVQVPMTKNKMMETYIMMSTNHIDKYSKSILYGIRKQAKSIRRNKRADRPAMHGKVYLN